MINKIKTEIIDEIVENIKQRLIEDEEPSIKKQRGGRRANTTAFMQKNRGISANKSMRGNVNADGTRKVSLNVGGPDGGVTLKTFTNYYKLSSNKIQKSETVNGTSIIKIIDYYDDAKTIKKLVALFVRGYGSKYILHTVVEFNEKGIRHITFKYNEYGYLYQSVTYADDGQTVLNTKDIPLPKDALAENINNNDDIHVIKEQIIDYYRSSMYKCANEDTDYTYKIRTLNEIGMNRLIAHMENTGIIIISACKSDVDSSKNKQASINLENDIRNSGYSYTPVFGGYTYVDNDANGNKTKKYVLETSFIVYNWKRKDMSKSNSAYTPDFAELKQFALDLCKKYDQESVYIQPAGQTPAYYDRNGKQISTVNNPNPIINRVITDTDAFTKLKKSKRDDAQHFKYDLKFNECSNVYVIPTVGSLQECAIRIWNHNESMLGM